MRRFYFEYLVMELDNPDNPNSNTPSAPLFAAHHHSIKATLLTNPSPSSSPELTGAET